MSSEGSVSHWLGQFQAGNPAAVQQLWQRYFQRLVGLARQRLQGAPRRVADEEDVALSVLDSFCRNAEQGRYPNLTDRDGLWRLLLVLTARKSAHLVRDQCRQKRGGNQTSLPNASSEEEESILEQALSREPGPELAAEMAEECRRLLAVLGDAELACVARWRMEGYDVEEIAERLGCAPRSVKRKLKLIREVWVLEVGP
jgi:DNA-directed RNA polymerase specialized sigma24 family protein